MSDADKDLVTKVDELAAEVGNDWQSLNTRLRAIEDPYELLDIDETGTTTTTAPSGVIYYNDPFTVNNQPIALSLPQARDLIIDTLTANPEMWGELVTVYAASWSSFYDRLVLTSEQHTAFSETSTLLKHRFGFSDVSTISDGEDPFEPETHQVNAADTAPIDHWQGRYDIVCAATLLTLYTE